MSLFPSFFLSFFLSFSFFLVFISFFLSFGSLVTTKAVNVAFFAVPSFDAVLEMLALARSHCGEVLSAFEYMDGQVI